MPNTTLTPAQKNRLSYAAPAWSYGNVARKKYEMLQKLFNGSIPINVGPRGGKTYGEDRLTVASFRVFKRDVEWYGGMLVEDLATKKVHLRPGGWVRNARQR